MTDEHGTLLLPAARFWAKVDKTESCWVWTACRNRDGYGRFHLAGRNVRAHRVAYELLKGPIPAGLTIDHLCRVHDCVNPAHLEPVTNRENNLRGNTVAATNAAKTHCPEGHALVEGNLDLYQLRLGQRSCRTCHNARMCAWQRARRARERARGAALRRRDVYP